jgi:hypothetical protein
VESRSRRERDSIHAMRRVVRTQSSPVQPGPGFTQEAYEETVRRITGGRAAWSRLRTGPSRACWLTSPGRASTAFGLWTSESEDAFRRFGETLLPILQEIGVEGDPEIYPAHTFVAS